jgi:hypothetical protein
MLFLISAFASWRATRAAFQISGRPMSLLRRVRREYAHAEAQGRRGAEFPFLCVSASLRERFLSCDMARRRRTGLAMLAYALEASLLATLLLALASRF